MIKTRNIQVIEVQDWDKLVEQTYGRTYSFQQQDGCKERQHWSITVPVQDPEDFENDTVSEVVNGEEMGVSFKAWLARDPKQPLNGKEDYPWAVNMWWDRNFYPSIDMVINDLHAKGLLPAGEYEINIDW